MSQIELYISVFGGILHENILWNHSEHPSTGHAAAVSPQTIHMLQQHWVDF